MSVRTPTLLSRSGVSRIAGASAAVAALAAVTVIGFAGPAAAHVTANPDTAEQGSFTKVSFRVPNEEDKANTTKLEVDLPLDHPIAAVSVRPLSGWTIKVTKSKLAKPIMSDDGEVTEAVSRIVWSKGAIPPGQFQEFDVSMGPLPTDVDMLAFKTIQTYSDGQVIRWDQPTPAGGQEPEHPAPALHLTKPAAGGDAAMHGSAGGAQAPKAAAAQSSTTASADTNDGTARLLGGLGLLVGVVGLGVGAFGLARGRARGQS